MAAAPAASPPADRSSAMLAATFSNGRHAPTTQRYRLAIVSRLPVHRLPKQQDTGRRTIVLEDSEIAGNSAGNRSNGSAAQFIEQRLGLLQIGGVEALGEPVVDFLEQ